MFGAGVYGGMYPGGVSGSSGAAAVTFQGVIVATITAVDPRYLATTLDNRYTTTDTRAEYSVTFKE